MNPTHALNRLLACVADVAEEGLGAGYGFTVAAKLRDRYGYYMLGSGHFSGVVEHPADPRKVVKIGCDIKDSWIGFAMYCKENPAPYLPVIEEIILFPKYYIAIMERLEPLTPSEKERWNGGKRAKGDGANCIDRIPESAAMFERLAKGRIDMHAENVMKRGTPHGHQLVIIDPFAEVKVPGYEHNQFVPKFGRAWLFTELDKRKAQENEALAAIGAGATLGGEAKNHALWELPKHDHIAEPARMAGVLPPMQRERVRGVGLVQHGGPRGIRTHFRNFKDRNDAFGLQSGIRGRRADFIVMDDLAPDGRDRRGAAAEVFVGMEQKVRESRVADLHAVDFKWMEQRVMQHIIHGGPRLVEERIHDMHWIIPKWAPTPPSAPHGQEPKVFDGPYKSRAGGLPKFRAKHWERGNKLPRGLRYNRGPALRNPRGGVRPVGSAVRDEPREGQAGPHNPVYRTVRTYDRLVGRPGQGRAAHEPRVGTFAGATRIARYMDQFA